MATNTPITKDWFILGFLSGVGASIAKSGLNYVIDRAGIPTTYYGSMASGAILGKKVRLGGLLKNRPRSTADWAVGYAVDTIAGGVFGIMLSYVYMKTPPGNETFKGIIGGASFWAAVEAAGRMARIGGFEKISPAKLTSLLVTGVAYGALHGWAIGKWGASLIDQSHPVLVKESSDQSFNRGRFRKDRLQYRRR